MPLISQTINVELVTNPENSIWTKLVERFSQSEGWDASEQDYNIWRRNDDFLLICVVDKVTRKPLASVSMSKYRSRRNDETFFYIGHYYTVPEARGLGLGRPIFERVVEIAGKNNIGLTGAYSMIERYKKSFNFDKLSKSWLLCVNFHLKDVQVLNPADFSAQISIQGLDSVPIDFVHNFDAKICILERKTLLEGYLRSKTATTFIATTRGNDVIGLISARLVSRKNVSIAPFYAENENIALQLLNHSLTHLKSTGLDLNEVNLIFPSDNRLILGIIKKLTTGKLWCSSMECEQFTLKSIDIPSNLVYSVLDTSICYV